MTQDLAEMSKYNVYQKFAFLNMADIKHSLAKNESAN